MMHNCDASVRRCGFRGRRAVRDQGDGSDSEGFYDASGDRRTDESPPADIVVPATTFYDAGAAHRTPASLPGCHLVSIPTHLGSADSFDLQPLVRLCRKFNPTATVHASSILGGWPLQTLKK